MRLRAYRSDPDGGLLGPLKATHFGFGDVEGFDSKLTGSAASGRGAVITNRPLTTQAAFDRTRFEGDLPSGWEAEIYRNGELLGFAKSNSSQRYVFDDVQLLYGENGIAIVAYGPQGQIKTREELINVGKDNVPAGRTWYWAGFNQPGKDLFTLEKPPDGADLPKAQATASLEHGIDDTNVGRRARAHDADRRPAADLRRRIGPAVGGLGIGRGVGARANSSGGTRRPRADIGQVRPRERECRGTYCERFSFAGLPASERARVARGA